MALAWRWHDRGFLVGVGLGAASLTKLLPAVGLVPFLLMRRWDAAWGVAFVWLAALAALLALDPEVFSRYAAVLPEAAGQTLVRGDNGALMAAAIQTGIFGVLAAFGLVLLVAWQAVRLAISDQDSTWRSWALWVWLSVALLPIAWDYSLLPLLPWLLLVLCERQFVPGLLAVMSLIFGAIDLPQLRHSVALSMVCAGLAFLSVTDFAQLVLRQVHLPRPEPLRWGAGSSRPSGR
jgi:hypothetical protein